MSRLAIALFPLQTVLFPGGMLPLRLFEQRYMEMAKDCLREEKPFGVCLIREGSEVGTPALHEPVGCLARIAHWDMEQLGVLNVVARGEQRFRVIERQVAKNGLAHGEVELIGDDRDGTVGDELSPLVDLLHRLIEAVGDARCAPPYRFDSCAWVSARLAELLPLPLAVKQQLLELDDAGSRMAMLGEMLSRAHAEAGR